MNDTSRRSSQMENELRDVNTLIRDDIHPKLMLSKQDKRLRSAEKEELFILRENSEVSRERRTVNTSRQSRRITIFCAGR